MSEDATTELRESISGLRGSLDIVVDRVGNLDDLKKSLDEVASQLNDVRTLAARAATTVRDGGRMDEAVIELATIVRSISLGFDALREVVERKEDDAAKLLAGVVDALHETAGQIGGLDRAVRAMPDRTGPGPGDIPDAVVEVLSRLDAIAPLQDEMARVGRAIESLAPQVAEIAGVQRALGELGSGLARLEETALVLAEAQRGLATGAQAGETVDLGPAVTQLEGSIERSAGSLARGIEWLHEEMTQALDAAVGSRTAPLQRAVDLLRDELLVRLESGGERGSAEIAAETAARLLSSLRSDADRVAETLAALREEQDDLTGGVRAIGLAQQEAAQHIAAIGADVRGALEASESSLAGLSQQISTLREDASRPTVAPEVRDGIARIDAALADARAQLASLAERPAGSDPQAMADLLAGITFVATKVDALARPTTAEPGQELQAIDATLEEIRARLTDLRAHMPEAAGLTAALAPLADLRSTLAASESGLADLRQAFAGSGATLEALAREIAAMREAAARPAVEPEIRDGLTRLDASMAEARAQLAELVHRPVGPGHQQFADLLAGVTLVSTKIEDLARPVVAEPRPELITIDATLSEIRTRLGELRDRMLDPQSIADLREHVPEALQRDLAEARAQLSSLAERPTIDPQSITDVLAGLTLVSTKIEDLARSAPAAPHAELTAIDATLTELRARLAELRERMPDGAALTAALEPLTELRGGFIDVRARIEGVRDGMPSLEPLLALAEEIRTGVVALASATDDTSQRTSADIAGLQERVSETTGHLVTALETLSGIVQASRDETTATLEDATTRIAARIAGELAGLQGSFVDVSTRLDEALARGADLAEDHASVGSSLRSTTEAIGLLASRAEQVSDAVVIGFDGARGQVGSFQTEVREAFTTVRDDVTTVRDEVMRALDGARTDTGVGIDTLRTGLLASAETLQDLGARVDSLGSLASSLDAIDARLSTMPDALDRSAAEIVGRIETGSADTLSEVRAGIDRVVTEVQASAGEIRTATDDLRSAADTARAQIELALQQSAGELARWGEDLRALLDAGLQDASTKARAASEHLTAEIAVGLDGVRAGLDATAVEVASQIAAAREDIRASAQHAASATDAIPTLLAPATEEILRVGGELERAIDASTAMLRVAAEAGTVELGRMVDDTTSRANAQLHLLAEAVQSLADRVEAQEASVIDEMARMGHQIPLLGVTISTAVDGVAEASGDLDRRAGEFVTLATDALGQFAEEVSEALRASRTDLDTRITSGIEGIASMIDERAAYGASMQATGQQALEARLDLLASSLEGRLQAMEERLGTTLDGLTADAGARLDGFVATATADLDGLVATTTANIDGFVATTTANIDGLVAAADARIEGALTAMPTADEVTQILHERAAGALRSVRRRLVRLDEVMASLASAESALFALGDRLAALEIQVHSLPTASDVVEVALSGRRGLVRKRPQPLPATPRPPLGSTPPAVRMPEPLDAGPPQPITETEMTFIADEEEDAILSLDLDEPEAAPEDAGVPDDDAEQDELSAEDELFLIDAAALAEPTPAPKTRARARKAPGRTPKAMAASKAKTTTKTSKPKARAAAPRKPRTGSTTTKRPR